MAFDEYLNYWNEYLLSFNEYSYFCRNFLTKKIKMKTTTTRVTCLLIVNLFLFSMFSQVQVLPKLRTAYSDYDPLIDSTTMITHHSVFHKNYIDCLNKSLKGTKKMNEALNDILLNISYYKNKSIRYNAGGHYNHSLYWEILKPNSSNNISEALSNQIIKDFISLDLLKQEMKSAVKSQIGSGWVWLIISPKGKLMVTSTQNEDNPIMDVVKERGVPVIGIDNWEHAYYLKHKQNKEDYFNAIWKLIDWEIVSEKFIKAIGSDVFESIKTDNWPELKVYKDIMSHTYHAAENGDLNALRSLSKEFMLYSIYLRNSKIPNEFKDDKTIKALIKLQKQSLEIHELCLNNESDKVLLKKMLEAHDTFHLIQGVCVHHDEHYHHFNAR